MSSRYSKPCNLIQSFIYQQYSFHLSQLCVRMCRQISQLIARGAGVIEERGSVILETRHTAEEKRFVLLLLFIQELPESLS